jgi:hypothetical protein
MVGWRVNNEVERIWKEMAMTCEKYCPDICLEGLSKTTKKLSWDSLCPGQDLHLPNKSWAHYHYIDLLGQNWCQLTSLQLYDLSQKIA